MNRDDDRQQFQGKVERKQAYWQYKRLQAPIPRKEAEEKLKALHEEIQAMGLRVAILQIALLELPPLKPRWIPGFLWSWWGKENQTLLTKEQLHQAYGILHARAEKVLEKKTLADEKEKEE